MEIRVEDNNEYDTGIHPEVTVIEFRRRAVGEFFKENRFPNLVKLPCINNQLTKLELNCPSLRELWCYHNQLAELELNCPSLQELDCYNNQLTKLELDCPSLRELWCYSNRLTNLELVCPSLQTLWCSHNKLMDLYGLEFCADLEKLRCSVALEDSVEILKTHLPDLQVEYL